MSPSGSPRAASRPPWATKASSSILRWSADVAHVAVARVRAELVLTLGGARGCTCSPVVCVDVWVEDGGENGQLAFCRGQIACLDDLCVAKVLWLGRNCGRNVHDSVKGQRNVSATGMSPVVDENGKRQRPKLTVAEAMLGLQVALLQLFGAASVSLQAMDNGSERLIRFYEKLGFVRQEVAPGSIVCMTAVASEVAKLAPVGWLLDMMPQGFNASSWLRTERARLWHERVRLGRLPSLSFAVSWPKGADVKLQLSKCTHQDRYSRYDGRCGCIVVEAVLNSQRDNELGCACGVLWLEKRRMTVRWLGRSAGKGVSGAVRGQVTFSTSALQGSADQHDGDEPLENGKVTPAVALLGVLAQVAGWFSAGTMEMEAQSSDSGSGKLLRYLLDLGFKQNEQGHKASMLSAACDVLAQRCCPTDWRSKLLCVEDLQREAKRDAERLVPDEDGALGCRLYRDRYKVQPWWPSEPAAPPAPPQATLPKQEQQAKVLPSPVSATLGQAEIEALSTPSGPRRRRWGAMTPDPPTAPLASHASREANTAAPGRQLSKAALERQSSKTSVAVPSQTTGFIRGEPMWRSEAALPRAKSPPCREAVKEAGSDAVVIAEHQRQLSSRRPPALSVAAVQTKDPREQEERPKSAAQADLRDPEVGSSRVAASSPFGASTAVNKQQAQLQMLPPVIPATPPGTRRRRVSLKTHPAEPSLAAEEPATATVTETAQARTQLPHVTDSLHASSSAPGLFTGGTLHREGSKGSMRRRREPSTWAEQSGSSLPWQPYALLAGAERGSLESWAIGKEPMEQPMLLGQGNGDGAKLRGHAASDLPNASLS